MSEQSSFRGSMHIVTICGAWAAIPLADTAARPDGIQFRTEVVAPATDMDARVLDLLTGQPIASFAKFPIDGSGAHVLTKWVATIEPGSRCSPETLQAQMRTTNGESLKVGVLPW